MGVRFQFDPEKAIAAILHVALNTDADLYRCLKIIYAADKAHLERYGRFIFGDRYYALDFGPVPSEAYDAIKSARGDAGASCRIKGIQDVFTVAGTTINPLRAPDYDVLSRSDIQALDAAIASLWDKDFGQLKDGSHDEAYHATQLNHEMSVEAIASTLANGPEVIQHLLDPYPDRRG